MPYALLMILNSTIYWPQTFDCISILCLFSSPPFFNIMPSAFASFIYKACKTEYKYSCSYFFSFYSKSSLSSAHRKKQSMRKCKEEKNSYEKKFYSTRTILDNIVWRNLLLVTHTLQIHRFT